MTFVTSALIASVITLPLLARGARIVGYNDANCVGGILMECDNMLPRQCCDFPARAVGPAWRTYGSAGFYGLTDLDTSYWISGPNPGCIGANAAPPQSGPLNHYLSRNIGTGPWSKKTPRQDDPFVAGGGQYDRRLLPPMQLGPFSGGDYRAGGNFVGGYVGGSSGGHRRLRRAGEESAEDPKAEQCPANGGPCGKTIIPTLYAYPEDENDKGVWILDPLPEDKYAALKKELSDAKKSEIDIFKAYGAKWVEDASQDPVLKAINEEEIGGEEKQEGEVEKDKGE